MMPKVLSISLLSVGQHFLKSIRLIRFTNIIEKKKKQVNNQSRKPESIALTA